MAEAPESRGARQKPHRGTMMLIFGIVGILCCPIFAILAWAMGSGDLKQIDAGQMDPSGRGLTQAGMIMGIIGVVWLIVALLLNFVFGVALLEMPK